MSSSRTVSGSSSNRVQLAEPEGGPLVLTNSLEDQIRIYAGLGQDTANLICMLEWNLIEYCVDILHRDQNAHIKTQMTYVGKPTLAQRMSFEAYAKMVWPKYGLKILDCIFQCVRLTINCEKHAHPDSDSSDKDAKIASEDHERTFTLRHGTEQGLKFGITCHCIDSKRAEIQLQGLAADVNTAVEVLAWVAASCSKRLTSDGLTVANVKITGVSTDKHTSGASPDDPFQAKWRITVDTALSVHAPRGWYNLFPDAVLAEQFRIAKRDDGMDGLEVTPGTPGYQELIEPAGPVSVGPYWDSYVHRGKVKSTGYQYTLHPSRLDSRGLQWRVLPYDYLIVVAGETFIRDRRDTVEEKDILDAKFTFRNFLL
ncbi:hypothetical protein BT63DRAFT_484432 [Microthyrium microscopicum]|uniref:Uncharacterized protein n=1 Tax=Microthyrium microscopicum TaxID=703497 RepID=A0A6A6TTH8_9PEZI|nr:hypothetical protein BT63DRAFT_484432 [Microthyrium microscopicum]